MAIKQLAKSAEQADYREEIEVSFKIKGEGKAELLQFLDCLSFLGSAGASREYRIEDGNLGDDSDLKFSFDGDGADKLTDIRVNGKPYQRPEKLPGQA